MRRTFGIGLVVLVLLVAIATGVGAYHAGYANGLQAGAKAGQVVRVVQPGYGFFPFGFLVFPLLFFGLFWVARAATWRRWHGHGWDGPAGHGPWRDKSSMAEEWHRRHHERMGQDAARRPEGTGTGQKEA